MRDEINGEGEDDGAIALLRDGVQRLQVTKLQGRRTLGDHLGRLLQGTCRLLLALRSDHFSSRLEQG